MTILPPPSSLTLVQEVFGHLNLQQSLISVLSILDAPSYLSLSLSQVLLSAEREKVLKYNDACQLKHASFFPICLTVDGLVGRETGALLKRLADRLSAKWDRQDSITLHWIHTKSSFAIITATGLCIRGSRSKWRGIAIDNGFGINPSIFP